MNQVVKEQWLRALRSGEYQQGRERLRDNDQFCCLGVLCDIAAKYGIGTWVGGCFSAAHEINMGAFLHPVVADWAGLDWISPKINDIPLTAFNDGDHEDDRKTRQHSFSEIADLIERYL